MHGTLQKRIVTPMSETWTFCNPAQIKLIDQPSRFTDLGPLAGVSGSLNGTGPKNGTTRYGVLANDLHGTATDQYGAVSTPC